jgi:hypothetical protein
MCLKVFVNGNDQQYNQLKAEAMRLGLFRKLISLRDLKDDNLILGNYFPGVDLNSFDEKAKMIL